MEKSMWVLDWLRRKRNKKAFRVIKVTRGCQTKHSLRLVIPTYRKMVQVQKTIVERVVEKQQKQLQKIQPVHIQVVQLHLHPTSFYHTRSINLWDHKKQQKQKTALRKEIMRLQRIGFLEEQAYFRTRPTLAKQMFHDLLIGKKPTYIKGSEKKVPIHLEILKQAMVQEPIEDVETHASIQDGTPRVSSMPKEWTNQLIKEVLRQLQKDVWRTGGISSWRK